MSQIVTFSLNPAVDFSARAPGGVAPGPKLRCEELRVEPGGGGLNVARVLQRLGDDVLAVWTCGGPLGELLAQLLEAEQLAARAIPIQGETRFSLAVTDGESERQFRFNFAGPALGARDTHACLDVVRRLSPRPAYLVLSGSIPPGVDQDLYARMAAAAGESVRVVVDASGAALREALQASPFLVKPNLRELREATGEALESDEELEAAASGLVADGRAQALLVTLGAGGAVLVEDGRVTRLRSPTVTVRSKVGAGDATVAGLVHRLVGGAQLVEAARYAVAAGAAAVMTPGSELCRPADVERLAGQVEVTGP